MALHAGVGFELKSGMYIPNSPERNRLNDMYIAAQGLLDASRLGLISGIKEASETAHSAANIEGVELLEPGDYAQDDQYRCAHYVFGVIMGEAWAAPYQSGIDELWKHPQRFLRQQGYRQVEIPVSDDIVAYTDSSPQCIAREEAFFLHFGILRLGAKVVSKFNQGPVVQHPINLVPSNYGDSAYFLRKKNS